MYINKRAPLGMLKTSGNAEKKETYIIHIILESFHVLTKLEFCVFRSTNISWIISGMYFPTRYPKSTFTNIPNLPEIEKHIISSKHLRYANTSAKYPKYKIHEICQICFFHEDSSVDRLCNQGNHDYFVSQTLDFHRLFISCWYLIEGIVAADKQHSIMFLQVVFAKSFSPLCCALLGCKFWL